MCGICGFNWENKELIKHMSNLLKHRGPDDCDSYIDKDISLGHRRLSIIDLSAAGKQPMSNEDGTIWLIYNGEIYNFKQLRRKLEEKRHIFKSDTDTEVIIHGYEEWGENVVDKLNGQFAFAIWDRNKKKLFLARDRLGIKPLYYYWNGDKFIFASEIKSLLCVPGMKRIINKDAAYNYINLRYIPGEETLFENIKKVLPGHTLALQENSLKINEYWDLPIGANAEDYGAAEKVRSMLEKSVQERLVADVPVGIYLSGGIDSASIAALAAQSGDSPVKTFSVGFDYNDDVDDNNCVDELHKARAIAEHFNTEHHEITVEGSITKLLPKILWHLDMPHGDPVIVPQFRLSELAAKKVKVVLSGEGADELFGGYVQYKTLLQAKKISFIPPSLGKKVAEKVPIRIFDRIFEYPSSIGEKGKEKVMNLIEDLRDDRKAYLDLVSITSKKDKDCLFTEELKGQKKKIGITSNEKWEESRFEHAAVQSFTAQRNPLLNRMLYYDTKTWLPDYVLQVNDRMTLAHSVEGRVPFLNHHLAEYVNHLHPNLKIKGKTDKFILRKAISKLLPEKVAAEKKHAFFMPLDRWYKEELKDLAENLFTARSVKERGFFNYEHMRTIWENYPKSKLLYGKQLFTLINFELWCRMFIDMEKIPENGEIKLSSLL